MLFLDSLSFCLLLTTTQEINTSFANQMNAIFSDLYKNSRPQAYYELVDGGYYFSVGGDYEKARPWSIIIQTNNKQIFEGETYLLLNSYVSSFTTLLMTFVSLSGN